ncbi:hypothetical protein JQN72_00600 [Phycicoccus sp. CSK15P-2]|nr:hypothetical protein [Phycicoccus sp. CSK15P-2]MBM6402743.1 hypothetical protein [Phycicoccus sp. CSK15P-2]
METETGKGATALYLTTTLVQYSTTSCGETSQTGQRTLGPVEWGANAT